MALTLDSLSPEDRLRLLKFVCSFAWADLEMALEERVYIERIVQRLDFDAEERQLVSGWLERPPEPEEVDPQEIPREHRQVFIDAARGVILADREIAEEELENLVLFRKLLA